MEWLLVLDAAFMAAVLLLCFCPRRKGYAHLTFDEWHRRYGIYTDKTARP